MDQNAQLVQIESQSKTLDVVKQTNLNLDSQRYSILFWYDVNGQVVTSRATAKLRRIWNAMTTGKTNGALVVVHDPTGHSDPDMKNEKEFVRSLLPILRSYLS